MNKPDKKDGMALASNDSLGFDTSRAFPNRRAPPREVVDLGELSGLIAEDLEAAFQVVLDQF
jgi:hypothetical protein